MSERAQLALDAAALEPGTSVRMVCPFCGGGSSNEACMVLTHADDGALLFVCHRAHCGASGRLGGGPVLRRPDARPSRTNSVPEGTVLVDLPPAVQAEIRRQWHFDIPPLSWGWVEQWQRVMMPVRSPKWKHRGWCARALDRGRRGAKTLQYRETEEGPFIHWTGDSSAVIVVVEDIPSAERLAQNGYRACAILGTYIDDEAQVEIVREAQREQAAVYVALDRDAAHKTFAYTATLGMLVPAYALLLPKDFKNMTDTEISDCMNAT